MTTIAPPRTGGRLSDEEALELLASRDLVAAGEAASRIRDAQNDPGVVTYIIDRNINYTNVCNVVCTFCAFYRRPGSRTPTSSRSRRSAARSTRPSPSAARRC